MSETESTAANCSALRRCIISRRGTRFHGFNNASTTIGRLNEPSEQLNPRNRFRCVCLPAKNVSTTRTARTVLRDKIKLNELLRFVKTTEIDVQRPRNCRFQIDPRAQIAESIPAIDPHLHSLLRFEPPVIRLNCTFPVVTSINVVC